jgi:hypothetical protein
LREERRLRVFKNWVLRKIFGPKRDKVTGEWRRLHKKELYAPYASPNSIWVIKSRRWRWAGHVAHMGAGKRCINGFGGENLREKDHLEDPSVDGMIILKWISKKRDGDGVDQSGSGEGQVAGSCECGNKPLGSTKCREFPD